MNTAVLAIEATRYLEAIDLFRSLELDITWRSETDEARALHTGDWSEPKCGRCAIPLVRINGQHVCLGVR